MKTNGKAGGNVQIMIGNHTVTPLKLVTYRRNLTLNISGETREMKNAI
jgi:hypothetical protein